tara:strand:+ start:102 stop:569 length:468 start_codon:yes stop_codon:yes gene_type:complete
MIYYIYHIDSLIRKNKVGATKRWKERCVANRAIYGVDCIITVLETMEGPDTPEYWQVVGDREWQLADEYGYDRGEHYRTAIEKQISRASKGASLGGAAGKGIPNKHLRALTYEQTLEIKSKHKPKEYSIKMLAEEYGVHYGTIRNVLLNRFYSVA